MVQVQLRLTIRRPHRHEVSQPAWTVAQFYQIFAMVMLGYAVVRIRSPQGSEVTRLSWTG